MYVQCIAANGEGWPKAGISTRNPEPIYGGTSIKASILLELGPGFHQGHVVCNCLVKTN